GISCRFECSTDVIMEDNFKATQLYLIAREALFNAAKHSGAGEVVLTLQEVEGGIQVSIDDNGRGMPAKVEQSDGMGLRIMRHRSGLINGSLKVDSSASGGTTVKCQVKRL